MPSRSRPARLALAVVVSALLCALLSPGPASAVDPAPSNPLAGHPFAADRVTTAANPAYVAWRNATGTDKALLAKTALQPRARWFGRWSGNGADLTRRLRAYIDKAQQGRPERVVPMAFFMMWPRGENDKKALRPADIATYNAWMRTAAAAIGSSRVSLIMEPDLPLVLQTPDRAARLKMVRNAVIGFSRLPNTTVYIDGGASDWLPVDRLVPMLRSAGINQARGFAYGATHYAPLANEIQRGGEVIAQLARAGVSGKKLVVDTADNARPFTYQQWADLKARGLRRNHFDNADACTSTITTRCVTLGIPPTTRVAQTRFGLPEPVRRLAATQVDAYLWFGRPWLNMQADPFVRSRTLQIGRTTPWQ